jgi:hypothetical protein
MVMPRTVPIILENILFIAFSPYKKPLETGYRDNSFKNMNE